MVDWKRKDRVGKVIQSEGLVAAAEFVLSMLAQSKIGLVGAILMTLIFAGIRMNHTRLAVGAAVVFAILMSQA